MPQCLILCAKLALTYTDIVSPWMASWCPGERVLLQLWDRAE